MGSGNTAPELIYPSDTAHITSELRAEQDMPPPAVRKDTPAQQRFRKQFLPMFMSLKQPAIPGIWGSWDPVEGQPKEPDSDWPQYNVADSETVPRAQQQSSSVSSAHVTAPIAGIHEEQNSTVHAQVKHASRSSPRDSDSTPTYPSEVRFLAGLGASNTNEHDSNHIALAPPQTHAAPNRPPSLQNISTDLCLPPPPSVPAHLFTATSQDRYTSPPPPPRHFNASTDLEKDAAVKRVISTTQNNNDNGPMWGVASRPPITFDGDEDYSGALSGDGVGVGTDDGGNQRGHCETRAGTEPGAVIAEEEGAAVQKPSAVRSDARGTVDSGNEDEAEAKGKGTGKAKEKPRGWFGEGSIWNV